MRRCCSLLALAPYNFFMGNWVAHRPRGQAIIGSCIVVVDRRKREAPGEWVCTYIYESTYSVGDKPVFIIDIDWYSCCGSTWAWTPRSSRLLTTHRLRSAGNVMYILCNYLGGSWPSFFLLIFVSTENKKNITNIHQPLSHRIMISHLIEFRLIADEQLTSLSIISDFIY